MKQKIIDIQDNNGDTPLHLATKKGYANTVRALLEAGADVSIENKRGEVIAKLANPECAQIIKEHTARQKFEAKEIAAPSATPTNTKGNSRQR